MFFDVILSLILVCSLIFSYIFEKYRFFVFVLGIITVIVIGLIVILNVINIRNKQKYCLSYIIAVFAVGLISTYKYPYYTVSTSKTMNALHVLAIGISIIIALYDAFCEKNKIKLKKERILSFFVTLITFIWLSYSTIRFVNYAFDLSTLVELEYVVDYRLDDGHGGAQFNVVYIEYAVHPKLGETKEIPLIPSIEVPDTYELQKGDIIKIFYRKGLLEGIYYTEYY